MNERMTRFLRSPVTTHTLVGVAAFGGGVVVGYFMSRRQTIVLPKPEDQLKFDFNTEGLADTRAIIDEEAYSSPAVLPEMEEERPRELVLAPEIKEDIISEVAIVRVVDDIPIRDNIFQDTDSEWDYEVELKYRDANPEGPYPLHRDEFYGNEQDFLQTTMTYYAGDDIMCNEEDEIVGNHEKVIGPLRFGHGSGDRNVYYVRNTKRRAEYEVLHDPGLYQVEVQGLEIEQRAAEADLKHSHQPGKFRDQE